MGREIVVIVKEGQNVISSNTVAEGSGRPLVIKAKSHQSYELKNITKGVAPDEIYVIRDGKNLKIKIGNRESKTDDVADIIIEEYFEHDCHLIGVAENGQYYNYIPQGADPEASYYSLGGETLVSESETDWLPIILGVLGAGAIAAAASGGGNDTPPPPVDNYPPDILTVTLTDNEAPIEGEITSDTVTNDTTPVISGITEAGAEVTAKDDGGNILGTATADGSGKYTITPTEALSEGRHYIQVTAADAAGNDITVSSVIFTVDTTAPLAPVLNDTDGSPITGTAEAGSTVVITDGNGNEIGTTTADGNGNFSYTPDTPLTHGTEIVATATDAAGNVSEPGTTTVNSDIPDAPVVIDDVGDIQGSIANNSTTDDTVPTIKGSGAGTNLQVSVYDDGALLGTTTSDESGNWSLEPTEPFADGSQHSITYTVNGGPASPAVQFTIDTTAPDSITALLTDDVDPIKGEITDGSVTNDTKPTISGTTEPGATVTIRDGTTVLGTVTADNNGNYTFTPTTELGEGAHSVTATAADAAGNSVSSATTDFTIQTSASDAAVAITGIADDTGIAGDFITNDNTLVFSGTNGSLGDGEKIQISLDGGNSWMDVTQDDTTHWSYDNTANTMTDGTYSVDARVIDAAGNVGSTDTQDVVVDTAAPTSDVAITGIADDTGIAGDFITNDNTLVFSGTNGTLGNDEKVQISLDGGNTWMDTTKTDATHWSYNNTSNTMTDGTYTVQARVIDAAGNVGSTDSQSVVVDTVAPTSTVTITAIAEDTGIAGDFITNDNTLVFSGTNGTLGNDEKVQISLDGGNTWMDTTKTDATHWSYNNTSNTMTDGTYTVQARVIDAAGNVGSTDTQSVVVDTIAPDNVAVAITGIDQDTADANDFITNDNTLVFSGTNGSLGNGEKVQISLDGGNTWMDTTKTDATHWSYNNTSNTMTDGTYTVQARVIDAAGNVGSTDSQSVVVDTVAPTSTVTITAIAEDTGIAGDFITADNTLVFSGTNGSLGNGEKVQISLDGGNTWMDTTKTDATHWSYNNTANTMTDGTYTVQARVIDAAGNVGSTDTQSVVVDTIAPDNVAVAITGIDQDTADANDFITNDNTLVFSGTNGSLGNGEKVQISLDGGNTWMDTTKTDATHWSYNNTANTMTDGTYTVQARVIDAAGNVGSTDTQSVVVDTAVPTSVTMIIEDDVAPIIGNITDGSITDDTMPTISGKTEAGATVTIKDGTVVLATVLANANGDYSFTPTAPLNEGPHAISVSATDAAGNSIDSGTTNFTVDITAPNSVSVIVTDNAGPVTGTIGNNGVTDDTTPTISGTTEAGATVTIKDGNTVLGTVDAKSDGTYTFTPTTPLSEGTHTISATAADAAGNSVDSTTTTIEIDITSPTATITMADPELTIGETSTVTITFSEPVVGFASADDVAVENGSLSNMTTTDGGKTWTGTFTPTANITDTTNVITLNDTYTDIAGNAGTTASADYTIDTTPPPVIDLGDDGKLIHPVFVDGKYYYYWDRDGDGKGKTEGGSDFEDVFRHDDQDGIAGLDTIFQYDENGNLRPDNLEDTTDTYRYAELGGYQIALPTFGSDTDGVQNGTEIDNNPEGEINPYYDDLVAIWDAFNGGEQTIGQTGPGIPEGWSEGFYWSASQYPIGDNQDNHYAMDLTNGLGGTNGDHDTYWVAVEVIF